MVALVRSWQDLAKILASIPMHLGKRAKIRVTGQIASICLVSRKIRDKIPSAKNPTTAVPQCKDPTPIIQLYFLFFSISINDTLSPSQIFEKLISAKINVNHCNKTTAISGSFLNPHTKEKLKNVENICQKGFLETKSFDLVRFNE